MRFNPILSGERRFLQKLHQSSPVHLSGQELLQDAFVLLGGANDAHVKTVVTS